MDPRSMAWRGAALISGGASRSEPPARLEHLPADLPGHFRTLPPPETHEAWMASTYSRWVERDIREKLALRHDQEMESLQRRLDEERGRHAETRQKLQEAKRQLSSIPDQQGALFRTRRLALESKQDIVFSARGPQPGLRPKQLDLLHKGMFLTPGLSTEVVLRECFREWALHSFRCALDRARHPRPDVKGFQNEVERIRTAGLQQWHSLHHQMAAAVSKYMEEESPAKGGKPTPKYGLGPTSADEARAIYGLPPLSHRSLWTPTPQVEEDRPPSFGLGLPMSAESMRLSSSGSSASHHGYMEAPLPSLNCLIQDRAIRWTDGPVIHSER